MSETKSIVRCAADLRRAGTPFLVATVVRVRGSAYRRPGARMLITEDRWIAGSVSGGCIEGDILRRGFWRTKDGTPTLVTYDSTEQGDEGRWGFGLGCDGVVDVLLERAGGPDDPLLFIEGCLEREERGAIATVFESDRANVAVGARAMMRASHRQGLEGWDDACRAAVASGETSVVSREGVDALVEAILPPVRLFVFGAGFDAVPVAELGRRIGWDVVVCEASPRFETRVRFAGADEIITTSEARVKIDASDRAVAVVMGHNYDRDRDALAMLLASRARYIGALGPRRRAERMLAELGAGFDDPRLHAPVGLDLRAETPHEIALAVIAEIQASLTGARATRLRDRREPIHAPRTEAR